mmetsp:Transcript_5826/g.17336  ORF Transcript_5826/g.17336 Transcript_5826/m.17336 type:complete len:336 (-) Transcript_5826:39-1046(-)
MGPSQGRRLPPWGQRPSSRWTTSAKASQPTAHGPCTPSHSKAKCRGRCRGKCRSRPSLRRRCSPCRKCKPCRPFRPLSRWRRCNTWDISRTQHPPRQCPPPTRRLHSPRQRRPAPLGGSPLTVSRSWQVPLRLRHTLRPPSPCSLRLSRRSAQSGSRECPTPTLPRSLACPRTFSSPLPWARSPSQSPRPPTCPMARKGSATCARLRSPCAAEALYKNSLSIFTALTPIHPSPIPRKCVLPYVRNSLMDTGRAAEGESPSRMSGSSSRPHLMQIDPTATPALGRKRRPRRDVNHSDAVRTNGRPRRRFTGRRRRRGARFARPIARRPRARRGLIK